MRSPRSPATARDLNAPIDAALLAAQPEAAWAAAAALPAGEAARLAERVRRRATALARRADPTRRATILAARERLVQALYARDTPAGWCTAWCDGTHRATGVGGIGGLILDRAGVTRAQLSRPVPAADAFAAEISALAAVLDLARPQRVRRLRVFSDCAGLVQLWHGRRADARLAPVRAAARALARVELRYVLRAHNQPAHHLARAAVSRALQSR